MNIRDRLFEEFEALDIHAQELMAMDISEEEQNALQEKLSEAKAAIRRLEGYAEQTVEQLDPLGGEAWSDFVDKLRDARDFIEARMKRCGGGF